MECILCGTRYNELYVCPDCNGIGYCSKACRDKDDHKPMCGKLRELYSTMTGLMSDANVRDIIYYFLYVYCIAVEVDRGSLQIHRTADDVRVAIKNMIYEVDTQRSFNKYLTVSVTYSDITTNVQFDKNVIVGTKKGLKYLSDDTEDFLIAATNDVTIVVSPTARYTLLDGNEFFHFK